MLYINDQFYSKADLEARWLVFNQNDIINSSQRLAVCTDDIFEWLALALFCQRWDKSIAPIPPDTSQTAAREKARSMACDCLVWRYAEGAQRLNLAHEPLDIEVEFNGGTLIQFSSGTTGAAKRIERRWSDIHTEVEHYNKALGLEPGVIPVVACPVTHSYGLICGTIASLCRGATPHIVTGWNPKFLTRILSGYRKPLLYSSPTLIKALLAFWPPGTVLYGVMTSGSLMPAAWLSQLKEVAGQVWQQYGCSEAGCVALSKDPATSDVMGNPLAHCSLVAGTSPGAPGEIVVLIKDRQIHTRDSGYVDTNGQLHFCGRLDDTIVVSGQNVYPQDVEDALVAHKHINEAVVFKISDPLAGERVAALYTANAHLTNADIRRWCNEHLTRYQWPSWFLPVDEIPRMPNGKISRKRLSEQYSQAFTTPQRQGAMQ